MTDRALGELASEAFRTLGASVSETNMKNGWTGSRELAARYNHPAHGGDRTALDKEVVQHQIVEIALIITEASEAIEELRKGRRADEAYYPTRDGKLVMAGMVDGGYRTGAKVLDTRKPDSQGPFKPEGVPSEIADVVIRCIDFAEAWGIDLGAAIVEKMAYNETRGFRHGGKKA